MQNNIQTDWINGLKIRLYNDEYFDFGLYRGNAYNYFSGLTTDNLIAFIDMDDDLCLEDKTIYSKVLWEKALNNGVKLDNIGFTAVDNGLISYEKDQITNKEFLKLFYFSTLAIDSGDTRLFLNPVKGNAQRYIYDFDIVTDEEGRYLALKGGFYQGFFKLKDVDYETLPHYIDSDWHFEFKLRKRSDYTNPRPLPNKGVFFYMGVRAENKFGEIYNQTYKPTIEMGVLDDLRYLIDCPYYEWESGNTQYFTKDVSMSGATTLVTSDGHSMEQQGYYEVKTDNKYIFFNRTKTGFTTDSWDGSEEIVLTGETKGKYETNPFILFNRTETGLTTDDVEEYLKRQKEIEGLNYDFEKDITNNAFALKIEENGAISYIYTIKDCESEEGYTTITESSLSGLVKDNEWCMINVRCQILNGQFDACGKPLDLGKRKMKLYFYLNGYLVYISKELPEFRFRELDEVASKQEGVPYNISIGGGSIGLAERIWMDYYQPIFNHYEIENNYAGSFFGDIKSFKMYNESMHLEQIRNNYKNKQ